MKSNELKEKAKEAEELEDLIKTVVDAEGIIHEICLEIQRFDIQEPHGWLSTIIDELRQQLENRLERL